MERPHAKYGIAIFARTRLLISRTAKYEHNDIEILSIELTNLTITAIYKPPNTPFDSTNLQINKKLNVIIGGFNSQHQDWGYAKTNDDGKAVESWAENQKVNLIHDLKFPVSFKVVDGSGDTIQICFIT